MRLLLSASSDKNSATQEAFHIFLGKQERKKLLLGSMPTDSGQLDSFEKLASYSLGFLLFRRYTKTIFAKIIGISHMNIAIFKRHHQSKHFLKFINKL